MGLEQMFVFLGSQMTSRIRLSISDELRGFLRVAGSHQTHEKSVDLDELLEIVTRFNSGNSCEQVDIADLTRDCRVVNRAHRNECIKQTELERMRSTAEERRYQRSISNLKSKTSISFAPEVKEMSQSMLFATHFVMAFLGAFLFGYFSTSIFLEWSVTSSAAAGTAAAVATLILETTLLILRDAKGSQ